MVTIATFDDKSYAGMVIEDSPSKVTIRQQDGIEPCVWKVSIKTVRQRTGTSKAGGGAVYDDSWGKQSESRLANVVFCSLQSATG
jgi:hypothetical protein